MIRRCAAFACLLLSPGLVFAAPVSAQDSVVVVELRVHGNHSIADAEILAIAGIAVGDRLEEAALTAAATRLRDSGRFDSVQIARRYRSLTRTDRVALVITVHEKASLGSKFLALPEIHYNEDQKFSFGGRLSSKDLLGGGEFISLPVLVRGLDRAALEVRRDWDAGFSLGGDFAVSRFQNPHFRIDDERVGGGVFAQYRLAAPLWLRASGRSESVNFGALSQRLDRYGASLTLDTRRNRAFAYDAVLLSGKWERLAPAGGDGVNRFRVELAGYKTVVGQLVLAVRGLASLSDGPLPEYEKSTVGGMVSLRGHRAGTFAGDNAVLGTVELRLPITAVRSIGRVGLTGFWDVGAAYDDGIPLDAAIFHHGVGGGVFLVAPIVRLNVDVGTDLHGSTRVHFGLGFRF